MTKNDEAAGDAVETAHEAAERARMMLRNGVQSRGELHLLDALDHVCEALRALGYDVHVTIERPEP